MDRIISLLRHHMFNGDVSAYIAVMSVGHKAPTKTNRAKHSSTSRGFTFSYKAPVTEKEETKKLQDSADDLNLHFGM